MDAEAAAQAWVEGWSRAWSARDPDALAGLYAEGAVFFSHPFRDPQAPGEYAAWAFADQDDVDFRFGEPIVDGDRAAVDWWAAITATDGTVETIAGISLLRFGRNGRVVEQRDAWSASPGRRELPAWAVSRSR